MKMLRKVYVIFVLVCSIMLLTACEGKGATVDQTVVHGTWVRTKDDMTVTYVLNTDGTFLEDVSTSGEFAISMSDEGTYTYDGKEIVLKSASYDVETVYEVTFEGADMIWDNGKATLKYVKQ